ncbi:MAG: alanine dehydrogenase [Mariprofundaceae bacterium]
MRIGVPKELKNREHRVALSPAGAKLLVADGHEVVVQASAGDGCGFSDRQYERAGAHVLASAAEIWGSELVVKVKEPLEPEYQFLRPELTLFTFLHLAADPELTNVLLARQVRAIGYETVQLEDGSLPLLAPMSHVAGRVAMQLGAFLLQAEPGSSQKGKGLLMGGIDGARKAQVGILGGGNVGRNAASVAHGMGAAVTVLDANPERLRSLVALFDGNISAQAYSEQNLQRLLPRCDLLIGAALIPGEHAPQLLSRAMLRSMQPGSVFIDVAIDQGGISETSRVTTYDEMTYVEEGVIHCCLPNLPAAVPLTSTGALEAVTLPYVRKLTNLGVERALREDMALASGVNTWDGNIVHAGVGRALGKEVADLKDFIM